MLSIGIELVDIVWEYLNGWETTSSLDKPMALISLGETSRLSLVYLDKFLSSIVGDADSDLLSLGSNTPKVVLLLTADGLFCRAGSESELLSKEIVRVWLSSKSDLARNIKASCVLGGQFTAVVASIDLLLAAVSIIIRESIDLSVVLGGTLQVLVHIGVTSSDTDIAGELVSENFVGKWINIGSLLWSLDLLLWIVSILILLGLSLLELIQVISLVQINGSELFCFLLLRRSLLRKVLIGLINSFLKVVRDTSDTESILISSSLTLSWLISSSLRTRA